MKNKIFRRNNPGTALSPAGHLSLSPFSLLRSPGTAWYRRPNWASLSAYCLLLLCPVVALADDPNLLVCDEKGYVLNSTKDASATGESVTYEWYENNTKLEGKTESTLTMAASDRGKGVYTYVRKAFSTECTDGVSSNPFTVQVLAPAAPVITAPGNVCQGVADLVFSASGDAGSTFTWTGGNAPTGDDHSTYTVLKSDAAQTYSLQATASIEYTVGALTPKTCTSGSSTVASAVVNPLPEVTQVSAATFCGSGVRTFEVSAAVNGVAEGIVITWYSDATGNTSLDNTGTTYTTPSLTTGPATYYVKAEVTATTCSVIEAVAATVNLDEGAISGTELP